jgi:4-amino-4-deoxy-L-arabinose transferase-like glycosyltransferase
VRRPLAAELAAAAGLLGALVVLLTRQIDVRSVSDEGVYVLSVQALEHGEALGREVFTSQPPGFYLWLRFLALPLGDSLHDLRVGMIVTVVIAAAALYVTGRAFGGPLGGLAAVAILAITSPLAISGVQVYADTPAYAFAAVAVACASLRRPALAGVAATAAVSAKLSGVTVIPAVLAVTYVRSARDWRAPARCVAGGLLAAALLAAVFARDLSAIWDGSVSYHVSSFSFSSVGFNAWDRLERGQGWITLGLLAAGLIAAAVLGRRLWPLWLWPVAGIVFVAGQKPLHDNHLLVIPYSFACAAGPSLATLVERTGKVATAALVAAGVLARAGGYVQALHWADSQTTGEDARLVAAAHTLERVTQPGQLVVSDQPIVALMAHRRVPGPLVDTAVLRFLTGSLTPAKVDGVVRTRAVDAVVVGRAFAIPEIEVQLRPYLRRTFRHRARMPAATIYYGRRQPPVPSRG